jgi:Protein of unknown function (DUF1997)
MYARFVASLPAQIPVPAHSVPIAHYLRQPQRLVNALVDPTRLERLGNDRFRIHVRPLNFMMLKIQPSVDLKIWAEPSGTVHLRSAGCQLRGLESLENRFHLRFVGTLVPCEVGRSTTLRGNANLEVNVELPPAFLLTPQPLLEAAGNALLMGVLRTIEDRLMRQLIADYQNWANDVTGKTGSIQTATHPLVFEDKGCV